MRVRDKQDMAGGATYHDGVQGRTGNPAMMAGNSSVSRARFPEDGWGWMCRDRRGRQAGIWGRRPAESLWVWAVGRPGWLVRGKWPPGGSKEQAWGAGMGSRQERSCQEGVGVPSDPWGRVGIESAHGFRSKERKTAQYFFYFR